MDFNELITISGPVVYVKRHAPWNWQAIDDKGVIWRALKKSLTLPPWHVFRECCRGGKLTAGFLCETNYYSYFSNVKNEKSCRQ